MAKHWAPGRRIVYAVALMVGAVLVTFSAPRFVPTSGGDFGDVVMFLYVGMWMLPVFIGGLAWLIGELVLRGVRARLDPASGPDDGRPV